MVKRKKRLMGQIEGLQKQIEIHEYKIKKGRTEKDTIEDYWNKEILDFKEQIAERKRALDKLGKVD